MGENKKAAYGRTYDNVPIFKHCVLFLVSFCGCLYWWFSMKVLEVVLEIEYFCWDIIADPFISTYAIEQYRKKV